MSSLLDNSLLNLITIAVLASGGTFFAVVLSGLLAALVMLGVFELFSRAKLQRSTLQKYSENFGGLGSDRLRVLAQARDDTTDDSRYTNLLYLQEMQKKGELFPYLAKMEGKTFYQLHYRQLCGQLADVVSSESARLEMSAFGSPLLDTLVCIAEIRGDVRAEELEPDSDQAGMVSGPASSHPDYANRYFTDLALRQIDVIQAELGSQISRTVFQRIMVVSTVLYLLTFISTGALHSIQNPFTNVLSVGNNVVLSYVQAGYSALISLISDLVAAIISVLIAGILALALGFATAAFGSVAFSWLDRSSTAK